MNTVTATLNFLEDESGAASSELVALTGPIVGLAFAFLTSVSAGATNMADQIQQNLSLIGTVAFSGPTSFAALKKVSFHNRGSAAILTESGTEYFTSAFVSWAQEIDREYALANSESGDLIFDDESGLVWSAPKEIDTTGEYLDVVEGGYEVAPTGYGNFEANGHSSATVADLESLSLGKEADNFAAQFIEEFSSVSGVSYDFAGTLIDLN